MAMGSELKKSEQKAANEQSEFTNIESEGDIEAPNTLEIADAYIAKARASGGPAHKAA